MQHVPHLLALAAVADVGELAPELVAHHPVGEDALVDLPHLPRAGYHPAAVDHGAQAECLNVLVDQELRAELGRAIERAVALEREPFGDAARRGVRIRLLVDQLEARLALLVAQLVEGTGRIDAAR